MKLFDASSAQLMRGSRKMEQKLWKRNLQKEVTLKTKIMD
jgi:hypothetical protein